MCSADKEPKARAERVSHGRKWQVFRSFLTSREQFQKLPVQVQDAATVSVNTTLAHTNQLGRDVNSKHD